MNRNQCRQNSEDQLVDQVEDQLEDQISDDELYDDAISKESANYYDRRSKNRNKIRQLDVWIVAGLYLILSSVAFVVLL